MTVKINANEDMVGPEGVLDVSTYTANAPDDVEYVVSEGKVILKKHPSYPSWDRYSDQTWLDLVNSIENP